jgi:hypothetical protein
MNFLIRYLEAKGAQDWMYRDEEFWVPKEQSLLKKGMGFFYRSDAFSIFVEYPTAVYFIYYKDFL